MHPSFAGEGGVIEAHGHARDERYDDASQFFDTVYSGRRGVELHSKVQRFKTTDLYTYAPGNRLAEVGSPQDRHAWGEEEHILI